MFETTVKAIARSSKRKSPSGEPGVNEDGARDARRPRICIRAVVEALSEWRVDANELTFFDTSVQNKGGSADITKATVFVCKPMGPEDLDWGSVHDVAVKKFRFSGDVNRQAQFASFANELGLLSDLRHDNVVKLVGFVENTEDNVAWIVLPWEANGNVREFVRSQAWVIPERISLIYDVACGIEYLHSRDPPVYHGDLKSLNVLVNSKHRAIITDFGSARKLRPNLIRIERQDHLIASFSEGTHATHQDRGSPMAQLGGCGTFITLTGPVYTLRWAAPEVLKEEQFDLASDIWTFGWICWEIMTGSIPFDDVPKEVSIVLRVARGDLPSISCNEHISQVNALCALMTSCWHMDPTKRPTATESVNRTQQMQRIIPTNRNAQGMPESNSAIILSSLGFMHLANGRKGEAMTCFQKSLNTAQSSGEFLEAAWAASGMAAVHLSRDEYGKAEELYIQARATFNQVNYQHGAASTAEGLGYAHYLQGRYVEAESVYRDAQEVYTAVGDGSRVAGAIAGLGIVTLSRDEYTAAEDLFTKAQEIYSRIGIEDGVTFTTMWIGATYRLRDEYEKAEALFLEGREFFARVGHERGSADAAWELGCVYLARDEYAEAEASFNTAQDFYSRVGNVKDAADTLWALGNVRRMRGDYAEAEAFYARAQEVYIQIGHPEYLAETYLAMGHVYRMREEYSMAESSYTEARDIFSQLGSRGRAAYAGVGLGDIHRLRHKYREAEVLYTNAQAVFTQLGCPRYLADTLSSMAKVRDRREQYDEAERFFKEASSIYRSLGVKRDASSCDEQLSNLREKVASAMEAVESR